MLSLAGLAAVPGARPAEECRDVTCLPSSNSAYALVSGFPGALPSLALHFVGRSAVIGTGLWLGGFRGREVVTGAVAASMLFEASLLVWSAVKVNGK